MPRDANREIFNSDITAAGLWWIQLELMTELRSAQKLKELQQIHFKALMSSKLCYKVCPPESADELTFTV